jgi:hypothetical protein
MRIALAILGFALADGDEEITLTGLPTWNSGDPWGNSATGWSGASSRAIDGNTAGYYYHGTCTHSGHLYSPWWMVRLDESRMISKVWVQGRQDCCYYRLRSANVYVDTDWLGAMSSGLGTSAYTVDYRRRTKYIEGRDVWIQVHGWNWMTVCEVKVYGVAKGTPISLIGLPSSQSSMWSSDVSSSRAIDGNDNTDWGSGSCVHTHGADGEWWKVTLPTDHDITRVELRTRSGCCWDRSNYIQIYVDNELCGEFGSFSSGQKRTATCRATGREIRLQQPGANYINFCEVMLYGFQDTGLAGISRLAGAHTCNYGPWSSGTTATHTVTCDLELNWGSSYGSLGARSIDQAPEGACDEARDRGAQWFMHNPYGEGKYECLWVQGESFSATHYTDLANYYGMMDCERLAISSCLWEAMDSSKTCGPRVDVEEIARNDDFCELYGRGTSASIAYSSLVRDRIVGSTMDECKNLVGTTRSGGEMIVYTALGASDTCHTYTNFVLTEDMQHSDVDTNNGNVKGQWTNAITCEGEDRECSGTEYNLDCGVAGCDTTLSTGTSYYHEMCNHYRLRLWGWTHKRQYHKGFLRNTGGDGHARFENLQPQAKCHFKIYMFANTHYTWTSSNNVWLYDLENPGGKDLGLTSSGDIDDVTLQGSATADGNGWISFKFPRYSHHTALPAYGTLNEIRD